MNDKVLIYFPYKSESNFYIIPKSRKQYETCEYGLPIPPQDLWLGYGKTNEEYLQEGKSQIKDMLDIVKESDFPFREGDRILDFGCAAGRMIRWLRPFAETCEIWGSDINAEYIFWANQYLKPPFNFATTTTIPHLPFEDGYFNFIYCGSVFTHIDDLSDAWLLELRRILSKESRLFITIHDNNTIKELDTVYKEHWLAKFMNENPLYVLNKDDFGILVNGRGPASQVFYDVDFFCDSIKTIFEVLSVTNSAYGYQTGILLKRK